MATKTIANGILNGSADSLIVVGPLLIPTLSSMPNTNLPNRSRSTGVFEPRGPYLYSNEGIDTLNSFGPFVYDPGPNVYKSATSTITFDSESSYVLDQGAQLVENTITFSNVASNTVDRLASANNNITFAVSAHGLSNQSAENTVTFTVTASANKDFSDSASNTITFTNSASAYTLTQSVSHTIDFTQTIAGRNSTKRQSRIHELFFTQTVDVSIAPGPSTTIPANNTITFEQTASAAGSIYNKSASNELTFVQTATRTVEATAENTVTFTASAAGVKDNKNTINFSSAATGVASKTGTNTVTFTQEASYDAILNRSVTTTLSFTQFAFVEKTSPSLCTYDPQLAAGNTDISGTAPSITPRSTIQLTYPYVSPTITLTLRTPNVGDTESFEYTTTVRETRGGDLKIVRKTGWPKSRRLNITVEFNSKTLVLDYVNFLNSSLGKEIGLIDHLSREWRGIILTPDSGYVRASRSNKRLNFEFEGTLV